METVFLLFETDIHKSIRSRIFLGIFTSQALAEIQAKKNKCYTKTTTADIKEIQLNKFSEI